MMAPTLYMHEKDRYKEGNDVDLPQPAGSASGPVPAGLLSPSLTQEGGGLPAFEMKFLVPVSTAQEIEHWASKHLNRDLHADPALGGAYRTTTLYCDTAARDVYHRTLRYRRNKFRLRRYGNEPGVYLERKFRRGDRVRKQRSLVSSSELKLLAGTVQDDWPGAWFHRELLERQLLPTCLIGYERTAFFANTADGPIRLTLDRNVQGVLVRAGQEDSWSLPTIQSGKVLLSEAVIVEFKFCAALPGLFKTLISELRLSPAGASKYRHCLDAWTSGLYQGEGT